MATSWKEELKLRFTEIENICRSAAERSNFDMKAAIINFDAAFEAGLRAWLTENAHVAKTDKDRSAQRDCHFPEVLGLIQKYLDLDNDAKLNLISFREVRNKVKFQGYNPPSDLVGAHLPSIGKVLQCLELDIAPKIKPSPQPPSAYGTASSLPKADGPAIPSEVANRACHMVGQKIQNVPFKHRGIKITHELIKAPMEILNAEPTKRLPQNCRNDLRERTPDGLDRRIKEHLDTHLRTANIISDVLTQAGIAEIVEIRNPQTGRTVKGTRLLPQWCW